MSEKHRQRLTSSNSTDFADRVTNLSLSIMAEGASPREAAPRKRKFDAVDKIGDAGELEVDLNAPEPPSKKALRKAKKLSSTKENGHEKADVNPEGEEGESAASKSRSGHGVWIGNLPFTATKEDVRAFLINKTTIEEKQITRLHLPEGRAKPPLRKPQNKGFAYVDFSTPEAIFEALQLSEKLLSGRRVLIKDAKSFEGRPEKPNEASNPQKTPSQKVFVGNLGFDTSAEDLKEHFSRCGAVSHVHAATFEDSGKSKGYAWVEFESIEAAKAAARGWVDVKHGRSDGNSNKNGEGDDELPESKREGKRVWVNRLNGRQLRMEFAEDSATRYKKRFGKDSSKGPASTSSGNEVVKEDTVDEVRPTGRQSRNDPGKSERRPPRHVNGVNTSFGYDRTVVQKLTGTIVEAEGKKITFD